MGGSRTGRVPYNVVMGSFFRKPLGLFTGIVVVGCILIAVGMTAFGGTSGGMSYQSATRLSPAQFGRANERICLSLRQQLKSLVANGKPRSLREVTRYLRRGTSIFDHLRTEYYGLVPPPSAAAPFRRLLHKLDVADRALHRLDHLSETRQWGRFLLLARSRWFKHIFPASAAPTKLGDMCRRVSNAIV